MMRYLTLMIALGCGKGDDKRPPPKVVEEPAPAQTLAGLKVTADAKPVTMTSATLVHRSDDSIQLEVANHELPCDSARRSERWGVPKDDVSFHATLQSHVAADGTRSYVIDRIGLASAKDPSITVKGDVFTVNLVLDDSGAGVEHWKHLEVHGTVTPTKCGEAEIEKDHPAIAKAKHPSTATVTIAGQQVAIAAATQKGKTILLSTEPLTCAPYAIAARAMLSLDADGAWRLEGGWATVFGNGGGLAAKPGKVGTSADGPTVELALSGSATSADYKIELAGSIEALTCSP